MNKTGSPTRIIDDELEIERINLSIGETDFSLQGRSAKSGVSWFKG